MTVMAKKQSNRDRHKERSITLRLHADVIQMLDALKNAHKTKRQDVIRTAIRKYLMAEGYWDTLPTGRCQEKQPEEEEDD